jgi:hypothetical protein
MGSIASITAARGLDQWIHVPVKPGRSRLIQICCHASPLGPRQGTPPRLGSYMALA